jgi:AAA+ superfamily predicted ATPase
MTTNAIEQLEIPIRLSFPVINVNTFELSRAEAVFAATAANVKKEFLVMTFKQLPEPNYIKKIASDAEQRGARGVVVFDPFFFERSRVMSETGPALKASLNEMERHGINYIIAGKDQLNEEYVYHLDLPAMQQSEIIELIKLSEKSLPNPVFDDEERIAIANNAVGLSHSQMKNVFTYCAYLKAKGQDYLQIIRKEKAHILRDYGLDVLEALPISAVGGLENIKSFLKIRKAGWDKNLPVKGVLLAGVPGGGKSLIAKAAASVLNTALVRLDIGRFYTKHLGETERQFSRALQTIEQISPVVVLIDEMEKFFGSSDNEHEVSKRLLGTFLYWLQERKEKIFIVATANRVHSLPPELMRAGRWDRSFFIDLPNEPERTKIFEIHLSKHKADINQFNIMELVSASQNYTGAEIEQAIIDAMYLANSLDMEMDHQTLLKSIKDITPTSVTRKADIDQIRLLGEQGFYPANLPDNSPSEQSTGRKVSIE